MRWLRWVLRQRNEILVINLVAVVTERQRVTARAARTATLIWILELVDVMMDGLIAMKLLV